MWLTGVRRSNTRFSSDARMLDAMRREEHVAVRKVRNVPQEVAGDDRRVPRMPQSLIDGPLRKLVVPPMADVGELVEESDGHASVPAAEL